MSVSLTKGQKVSLSKRGGGSLSLVRMGLGWDAVKKKGFFGGGKAQSVDLDASALLLDAGGKSYREIAAEAHAIPTTVVRVARYLKDMPHQGYRIALDRLKNTN